MREKSQNPPEVIMLTGQATVESAIEAMKLGAYDYLTKPYRITELAALVTQAAEKQKLKIDNQTTSRTTRTNAQHDAGNRRGITADEGSFAACSTRRSFRYIGFDNGRKRHGKRTHRAGDSSSQPALRKNLLLI